MHIKLGLSIIHIRLLIRKFSIIRLFSSVMAVQVISPLSHRGCSPHHSDYVEKLIYIDNTFAYV